LPDFLQRERPGHPHSASRIAGQGHRPGKGSRRSR
jgi:hypothetical protein